MIDQHIGKFYCLVCLGQMPLRLEERYSCKVVYYHAFAKN